MYLMYKHWHKVDKEAKPALASLTFLL